MYDSFLKDIQQFIPAKRVITDYMRRLAWGTDASFYRLIPRIVLHTENEKEIIQIIKTAQQYGIPLTFRAAGTSLSGQSLTDSVLVIAGKQWDKYQIAEDKKSIRMQPGLIGQRANNILKAHGKRFPPDPASINSAMVGGIVLNNASGMSCGIHENSYKMIQSARLVLADGTVLDTSDEQSKEAFKKTHPDFIQKIIELRDKTRANRTLFNRIRKKYSIKNVTGLNILPFSEFDDPFDIITRLIVGSEGTLAFLSELEMQTTDDMAYKSTAMIFFEDTRTASELVVALKQSRISAVEFFDRKALKSVENESDILPEIKNLPEHATALLLKIEANSEHQLADKTAEILNIAKAYKTLFPVTFTTDPKTFVAYWKIRSGIFPTAGAMRPLGTTCLIEDVCFPMEVFADAVDDLRKILDKNGYDDAVIYGHALEGNYHFILNQFFNTPEAIAQYTNMMNELADLVLDKYDGSLKAEHGTGRNMAPFVQREWGDDAFELMREIKYLFDPNGILNPGVIFNEDPDCYVKNIKPLPLTHPIVDKCIECGFCEVNCLSWGFTLSPRQRIVVQREISRLRANGENPKLLKELEKAYVYDGEQTCAVDGLCMLACPVSINVGDFTQVLREQKNQKRPISFKIGAWTANNFKGLKSGLKFALGTANITRKLIGNKAVDAIGKGLHHASGKNIPLWTATLPKSNKPVDIANQETSAFKVVYFPSCLNQMMGPSHNDTDQTPLTHKLVAFLQKAGYQVIFPPKMDKLCCGTIWESKGMPDIANSKTKELEQSLLIATENGKYPVLCDQSPCLLRMRNNIQGIDMYEPVEFIDKFLLSKLEFTQTDEPITVHATCSTIRLGLTESLVKIAELCSTNVLVPDEVGCCGFAGDKGFFVPELNKYALRKLPAQINKANVKVGYSNSRTCEIGLNNNSGIPYMSIVYLVDKHTTAKK